MSERDEVERLTAELAAARSEARALRSAFDTSVDLHAKLRAALQWALEHGVQAVGWGSGFMHRQEYEVEPPAEIDSLVREVRREILARTEQKGPKS